MNPVEIPPQDALRALSGLNLGYWMYSRADGTTTVDHRTRELLGFSPEQPVPPFPVWQDMILPRQDGQSRDTQAVTHEVSVILPDGQFRYLMSSAAFVRDDHGAIIRVTGVLQDITAGKLAEEELEETIQRVRKVASEAQAANRAKSDFLANMSHEVRTPIQGITGVLDLLDESHLTAEQHRLVQIARRSARGLKSLVADILDLARMETERLELELVDFSLRDIAEELEGLLELEALDKNIRILITLDPSVPSLLHGDARRIRQILLNVGANAVKHTTTGSVSLAATWKEGVLTVTVTDTGPGIPRERRSTLFAPFSRPATMDLGLAICHQLATLMGGTIAHRDNPGGGSVFEIAIPLDHPPQEETGPPDTQWDRPAMMDRLLQDPELVHEILTVFFRDLQAWRQIMEALTETLPETPGEPGELEKVAEVAHRIKGASANIAAAGLSEAARGLEAAARRGDHQGTLRGIRDIRTMMASLEPQIQKYLDTPY